MRYLVEISQRQSEKIQDLIRRGLYINFAQFISTAIENQVYIEESNSLFMKNNQKIRKSSKHPLIQGDPRIKKIEHPFFDMTIEISDYNIKLIDNHPKTVLMPAFEELSSYSGADEEQVWLWGQINKILPVKIGLRILYKLIGSNEWVDLEQYIDKSAKVAAVIGTFIRKYEEEKNKLRDEKISAGLPGSNEYKSQMRYKTHFLVNRRSDGKLDGAMCFLRFVNISNDRKGNAMIGITEPGSKFAMLENPVIDKNDFESSLSLEEKNFYLDHIKRNVRGEYSSIIWLLNILSKDIHEREIINSEIKKTFGEIWKASDPVINTQRAGLMSRMFELDLIEKEKKGIRVSYNMSQYGRLFLESTGYRV
jgi:hypothetical protein